MTRSQAERVSSTRRLRELTGLIPFDAPESWRDGLTEHFRVMKTPLQQHGYVLYDGFCREDAEGLADLWAEKYGRRPQVECSRVA